MLEKKYCLVFKDDTCMMHNPSGQELMDVKMKNRSFSLHQNYGQVHVGVVEDDDLWHRKSGHCDLQSLKDQHRKGLVENMTEIKKSIDLCAVCEPGKQVKLGFSKTNLGELQESCSLSTLICIIP